MRLKAVRTVLSFLLLASIAAIGSVDAPAFAADDNRPIRREEIRDFREQHQSAARPERIAQPIYRQEPQPPSVTQQPLPSSQAPEGGRHNGHMSVEERRALRRQIDQANHDIYSPSR